MRAESNPASTWLWPVVRAETSTVLLPRLEVSPYSTLVDAGSLVVHVTVAEVAVAATVGRERAGAVLSNRRCGALCG